EQDLGHATSGSAVFDDGVSRAVNRFASPFQRKGGAQRTRAKRERGMALRFECERIPPRLRRDPLPLEGGESIYALPSPESRVPSPESRVPSPDLINSQFLELVPQRAEGDAQFLRSGGLVVAGFLQHLDDGFALDVGDVVVEADAAFCV